MIQFFFYKHLKDENNIKKIHSNYMINDTLVDWLKLNKKNNITVKYETDPEIIFLPLSDTDFSKLRKSFLSKSQTAKIAPRSDKISAIP